MTFRHILVPLDFSSSAEQALECAMELVEKFQARLTLLHVIHIPVTSEVNLTAYLAEMDTSAQFGMDEYLKRIETAGHTVETIIQRGTPWNEIVGDEFNKEYFQQLQRFVALERKRFQVFPAAEDVFHAFDLTPPDGVKVLILGQDPYHGPGQAHGLSFSVPNGVKPPPTLANIFTELQNDVGIDVAVADHGLNQRHVDWLTERDVIIVDGQLDRELPTH